MANGDIEFAILIGEGETHWLFSCISCGKPFQELRGPYVSTECPYCGKVQGINWPMGRMYRNELKIENIPTPSFDEDHAFAQEMYDKYGPGSQSRTAPMDAYLEPDAYYPDLDGVLAE